MFVADMSGYQPEQVDFVKLKGLIDLVILRDQFGYTIKDAHYDGYVKGCEAAGLPFNTYAFFDAVSVSDAVAEANSDIQRMSSRSAVAWIDIETVSVKSGKDTDLVAAYNAYYDTLKKAGFQKVGLYSGEYFFNTHGLKDCKHDCLWLAKYNNNDGKLNLAERPQVPCDLWQFTSVGAAAGISPLDMSVLVGSKPLSYFTGIEEPKANQLVNGPPVPLVVPDLFCMKNTVIAKVQSVANNDIRRAPSHQAGYVRNTTADEVFDCYDIVQSEADNWYAIGQNNWICSNGGKNAKVIKMVAPPPAPAPAPAPPAVHTNIVIPNLQGSELAAVQDYIKGQGWWFAPTRNNDDTITIETGIFTKDSSSYMAFTHFLILENYKYTEKAPS